MGFLPGLASPPRAAPCLANPAQGYFQNNWLAGLQKCLGLVFLEEPEIWKLSARDERGVVPGRQVPCQGWMGPPAITVEEAIPRAANREGETMRQRVPEPPGWEGDGCWAHGGGG